MTERPTDAELTALTAHFDRVDPLGTRESVSYRRLLARLAHSEAEAKERFDEGTRLVAALGEATRERDSARAQLASANAHVRSMQHDHSLYEQRIDELVAEARDHERALLVCTEAFEALSAGTEVAPVAPQDIGDSAAWERLAKAQEAMKRERDQAQARYEGENALVKMMGAEFAAARHGILTRMAELHDHLRQAVRDVDEAMVSDEWLAGAQSALARSRNEHGVAWENARAEVADLLRRASEVPGLTATVAMAQYERDEARLLLTSALEHMAPGDASALVERALAALANIDGPAEPAGGG